MPPPQPWRPAPPPPRPGQAASRPRSPPRGRGAPGWLADELERAWQGYGPGPAAASAAAAAEPGPDVDALRALAIPAGVVGLVDDPVHPLAQARHWRSLLPRAVLQTATLDALGADPAVLGRAAVLGWLRASQASW